MKFRRFLKWLVAAIIVLCIAGIAIVLLPGKDTSIPEGQTPPPPNREINSLKPLVPAIGPTKPNIILINADDLGYGDLGSYGAQAVKTPNIDRLAQEGVRFTDFYSCNGLCTPSRSGLLTGRYPQRIGMHWVLWMEDLPFMQRILRKLGPIVRKVGGSDIGADCEVRGLPEDEITLAEALREGGYQTGIIGKWHQGDFRFLSEYHPLNHGFDYFYGMPWDHEEWPCPLYENHDVILEEWKDLADMHQALADAAMYFVKNASENDKPFFLYYAPPDPHRPLFPSQEFKGTSSGGLYGDVVEEMDANVGQLLDMLTKKGLYENTVVIFTSDNGPWFQGSTGGRRGRKGQSYEGGFNVPMIARWPGRIPPGRVSNQPAMNIDFLPTLLSIAGIDVPQDRIIDGKDISGLLTGQQQETPHRMLYFYHHAELEGVRSGKWKFYKEISTYTYPVPVDKWHFGAIQHRSWLYNLETDPTESYPLNAHYPEVVKMLAEEMDQWQKAMEKDPLGMLNKQDGRQ
jgi:arylsulfatase A